MDAYILYTNYLTSNHQNHVCWNVAWLNRNTVLSSHGRNNKTFRKAFGVSKCCFYYPDVHGDKDFYKLNYKEKVSLFRVILLMLHIIIIRTLKNILNGLISITTQCNIFSIYNISSLKLKQWQSFVLAILWNFLIVVIQQEE